MTPEVPTYEPLFAAQPAQGIAIGARAKGFVVSTGSPFPLDTNPRLLDTLVATAKGKDIHLNS